MNRAAQRAFGSVPGEHKLDGPFRSASGDFDAYARRKFGYEPEPRQPNFVVDFSRDTSL